MPFAIFPLALVHCSWLITEFSVAMGKTTNFFTLVDAIFFRLYDRLNWACRSLDGSWFFTWVNVYMAWRIRHIAAGTFMIHWNFFLFRFLDCWFRICLDRARRDVHFSVKCPLFRFFLLGWARRLLDHNLSGRVISTDVSLQIVVLSLVLKFFIFIHQVVSADMILQISVRSLVGTVWTLFEG